MIKAPLGADRPNSVKVEFTKMADGIQLLVDFSFPCCVGKAVGEPSLIAKCQFFPWIKPQGDTSEAFWDVLQATVCKDKKRKLFVTMYPVEWEKSTWTRLDFKASL
jgi:hypothetical protein